ncbi:transcriptional regulator ATRX homolog isoform X2 [Battus philenor]|uniref:transcriptional regulator ATRX homolog isoform X2 n=1 Tax=Battus philenor TaxID=42288 RepID=UPI0035D064DC
MADAVPVCDVLCEAMEYLSKLGANLKVRSENLKEKKIRRDRLKNAHAVQKAANKVLLICDLSKKSLENVETGVKNLLSKILTTQGPSYSGGKTRSTDSNDSYEYFEFESKQLKIRKKVSLKHYMSAKVVASAMPLSMLDNYPVYYTCKLYQRRKKLVEDKLISLYDGCKNSNVNITLDEVNKVFSKRIVNSCVMSDSPLSNCDVIEIGTNESEKCDIINMAPDNPNNLCPKSDSNNLSSNMSKEVEKNEGNNENISTIANNVNFIDNDTLVSEESNVNANLETNYKESEISDSSKDQGHDYGENVSSDNNKDQRCDYQESKIMDSNKEQKRDCKESENADSKKHKCDCKKSEISDSNKERRCDCKESETSNGNKEQQCDNKASKISDSNNEHQCDNKESEISDGSKELRSDNKEKDISDSNKEEKDANNQQPVENENMPSAHLNSLNLDPESDGKHSHESVKESGIQNNSNILEHDKDAEKTEEVNSVGKTPFLKCVNINKLLEVPKKENASATKNIKKSYIVLKLKSQKVTDKANRKVDRIDKNKYKMKNLSQRKSDVISDESSDDDKYWKHKRKEVKLFKPKQFTININRLPSYSTAFMKVHNLNTITHGGLMVYKLESCSESQSNGQNLEAIPPEKFCLPDSDKNVHNSLNQCANTCSLASDVALSRDSPLNTSDKSLNDGIEKDLLDIAKNIKDSLLNDSDENPDKIINQVDNEPVKRSQDVLDKLEELKEVQNKPIENTLSPSQCKTNTSTVYHLDKDIEKVKSSLLEFSSDDDLLHPETVNNDKNTLPENNEDPEAVKSLLLNECSNESLSFNKSKESNENDTIQDIEDPEKIKTLLLNDYSDSSPTNLQKRKEETETGSPSKSKRKLIMESMHAKKMLLTYSSSSDTDDEQLRNALKEIKDALIKGISSDEDDKNNSQIRNNLTSDSENDVEPPSQKLLNRKKRLRSSTSRDEDEKIGFRRKKKGKVVAKESENEGNSNSSLKKMGGSRAKQGSSSSHSSDAQDANDKDIDGLTNLNTLSKSRRRRVSSSEQSASTIETKGTQSDGMPKAPRFKAESLLKAESSSDAPSLAGSDEAEEVEELPTVSMSALNGDGISHLAKDDLLGDSDSSSSHNEKSQEELEFNDEDKKPNTDNEEEEANVKSKRRKGHAISSDSEAGSSRRRDRGPKLSDFEDSDDEGSEPAGNKKRKKKPADSDDNSSVDSGKKKRRRIKDIDDSEGSDSDTENEGRNKHGRKNIRKVMGKNQLEEATKKAAREEKERIARIAERQKLYNNLEFDESGKPDEVILEKVVLDFDPETKEPWIEVDRGLVKKLKPHQANGIKFMWDACFESVKRIKKDKGSGCILAHCMGLGKTLQVVSLTHTLLTHSDLTGVNRVLVVCPLSTVLNWVNEFRIWLKHTEKEYDVDVYELSRYKQNSERAFQLQQWFESGGVCVLGYEMFRNLSADNPKKFKKKMLKSFQESLVDPGPDLVVCDEGHLLKNEKTSLSQSMNRVKTRRRIVLTGTPLQNNLKEYYCMVQFVKPNLLGKYNEYLNRFVNPITNGQYTDSTEHDIRVMKRRSHVLHKMLDGAVQRRDYGVLAPFLPPKHEYVLFITLTEVQIKLYQHYLDNYSRRPLPGKSSGFLFPDFQSLQRIWTHPLVLKYNSERYEIMQQKKREREEEDSEGSLVDFIDDDSTPDESSSEESSDDYSDVSDDSRKKGKKRKTAKKSKVKDSKVTTRRGTRANPVEQLDEDVKPLEVLETKYENPTEWWIKLVTDDELEDMRNSHKLVLLFDILRQCETIGDKLLVFSQSLYSLDLIEHFLGKVDEASQEGRIDEKLGGHVGSWSPGLDYFRLDGSTSCENRSIWCKNFNREDNPRARLFLISTRAGGLGINLVAANRVVIFDVSWNPSHDVQSIFRVYRFGQKKPCYIYRFLAMGTMEEKIYERQVTKQAISKRVIDEQQIDRHYAENDLAELYKFSPRPPAPRPLPPLPRDRLFAEMLREHDAQIYKYHEHDSLLENKEEETLSEEERKAAWEDFENEKNRPPPAPFPAAWQMPNGMVPGLLAQQQQQLAFAALGAMLRKDMPNITDSQIREMLPLIYSSNPGLLQKMSEIYKYAQPGMMNAGMMNPLMNPGGGGAGSLGGTSGLQYEPPWQRQQQQQQQMRLQQMLQQQHQNMGAKYYAGGLGSRDPVAMALQQQRAREIMLGERGRPRGRPPLQRAPTTSDVVNLADSD